jgi:uncharacterized protein (TIGR03437 family)
MENMKKCSLMTMALMVLILSCSLPSRAQSNGPTAAPGSLSFIFQMNGTFPAAAKLLVSLPATSGTLPLSVTRVISSPQGWLTVTPDTGHSPFALTVTVNPTGLTPGSYAGNITIDSIPASKNPAVVAVTLSISNPPSTIVLAAGTSTTNFSGPPPGSSTPSLLFLYTTGTGAVAPVSSELDISSTGDIIAFTVTAGAGAKGSGGSGTGSSAVWLRVSSSPTQIPSLATSGSAFPGSSSPVYVTLDLPTVLTLDPGSYAGQITVAAANAANGSWIVSVNLVVSAGPPMMIVQLPAISPIYPYTLIASPVTDPVITINGDNFFTTSVVTIQSGANPSITVPAKLLSRKVLEATIKKDYFSPPITTAPYPVVWTIAVTNPAPPNNPSQFPVTTSLTVTDPTLPAISSVVNSASYLATSVWTGALGANPVTAPNPPASVSPREIISIFGQNLGPALISTATPAATASSTTLIYPTNWNGVQVQFQYFDPSTTPATSVTVLAPIIMTSNNQINAVVPKDVAAVVGTASPNVKVTVINGSASTTPYSLTAVKEDPGAFTFGGLGQGQGAILNYDSSGVPTINSAKNTAVRGASIAVYVTGMGELLDPTVPNGAVLPIVGGAIKLNDTTCRVDIDGQPAVVTYAGSSPGAIAGLVQVNAIVPPTVRTGPAITITVSIGDTGTSRRSQPGMTFAVK